MIVVPLLLAFAFAAQDQPPHMATLSGTAVNSATGAPLGKVELRAIPLGVRFAPMASTTTDAKGNFTLVNLPPGEYRLKALRNGYLDTYYGSRRPAGEGTVISLEAGQEIRDLRVKLAPYSVLAGIVRDPEGEPISGATLLLFAQSFETGHRTIAVQGAYLNKTDDLGQYRIADLAPGKYYVQAVNRIAAADSEDPNVVVIDHSPRSAGVPRMMLPTWYPSVLDPAVARIVELGPQGHVTGIDITLVQSPTYRVVVHSTAAAGLRVQEPWLIRPGFEGADLNSIRPVKLRDSDFLFTGIPPGSYVVEAHAAVETGLVSGGEDQREYRARMPITVDRDVEGFAVSVQRGAEVTVRVTVEGETHPKVGGTRIVFHSATGDTWSVSIRQDNTFAVNLDAVRYDLSLEESSTDLIVKSVKSEGEELFERGVTIPESGTVSLEMVLAPDGGQVEGVVLDPDEKPVAGATVLLLAKAELRARTDSFRSSTADQKGHFHFENVRPGDYKLLAWDDVEPNIWFDPEFLKKWEDRGEPAAVAVRAKVAVPVHLLALQ